jgi:hypothetical protein
MNSQTFPAAAKSLIETGRSTLVNAIDAGCESTQRTFNTCDRMFKTGTDALAQAPIVITNEVRASLLALEGQLPLIATLLTQAVAEQTTEVVNRVAGTATVAADSFEHVFDLRIMQALERMGVPAGAAVRELADRVALLAREIERLLNALQAAPRAPAAGRKAPRAAKPRSVKTRRAGKRAAKTAA